MSIPRFAIERPVMMTMISAIVILIGGISLTRLPVDLLPDISQPTISVRVNYTGVGPLEMEELVTRPLEQQLSAVSGLEQMNSSSGEGNTNIQMNFVWGTDLNEAMDDMRTRIDRVRGRLPEDADPPVIQKFDSNAAPIMGLAVESTDGSLDRVELREMAENVLSPRLERVPGVAAVTVNGGLRRQIHVNLSREKITGSRPLGRPRRQRAADREPEHPHRRSLPGRPVVPAAQPGPIRQPGADPQPGRAD